MDFLELENGMIYYIYNTRFQPFNNENYEELKWLINKIKDDGNKDKIILGIVNPSPNSTDPRDYPMSWKRFRIHFNPLNYWQRYRVINIIVDKLGCREQIAGIVPMSRPSVNMEGASNYLPDKCERRICVPRILNDELEETKIEGLINQEESYLEIPAYNFDAKNRIISPELITCLIALRCEKWVEFVPECIRDYLRDSVKIEMIIRKNFQYDEAEDELKKIYKHMKEEVLHKEMMQHFSHYLGQQNENNGTVLPTVR